MYGNADDLLAAGEYARAGRRFERENRWEEAIDAYARAKRFDEAARLLETLGRFDDAGWMLLRELPPKPTRTLRLAQDAKRAAVRAAMNFARAGARDIACGLLINVGEGPRAAGLLRMAGRRDDAVLAMQGRSLPDSPWPDGVLFTISRATLEQGASPPEPEPEPLPSRDEPPATHGAPFAPPAGAVESDTFSIEIDEDVSEFDMPAVSSGEAAAIQGVSTPGPPVHKPLEAAVDLSSEDFGLPTVPSADLTPSAWLEAPTDFEAGTDASFGFNFGDADDDHSDPDSDLSGGFDAFSGDPGMFGDFLGGGSPEPLTVATQAPSEPAASEPEPPSLPSGLRVDTPSAVRRDSRPKPVRTPKKPQLDPDSVEPGTILADRYRIERLLGEGATARVFEAMDLELDETVALKLFVHAVGSDEEAIRRFRREVKLSRDLIHPNVVHIFEFGVRQGLRFITMELLDGEDLKDYTERRGGVLKPPEAARLMLQAAAGLKAAHEMGVIHRDIKPTNLFVLEDGALLKVMDFGLASVNTEATISDVGARVGTPRYMSPEQMRGKKVGPPADLYSLGVVFYEILTGKRTVDVEAGLVSVLLASLGEMPPPPIEHNRKIPRDLSDLVMRLLAKDPADRYASADKLRRALMASSALKTKRRRR